MVDGFGSPSMSHDMTHQKKVKGRVVKAQALISNCFYVLFTESFTTWLTIIKMTATGFLKKMGNFSVFNILYIYKIIYYIYIIYIYYIYIYIYKIIYYIYILYNIYIYIIYIYNIYI